MIQFKAGEEKIASVGEDLPRIETIKGGRKGIEVKKRGIERIKRNKDNRKD